MVDKAILTRKSQLSSPANGKLITKVSEAVEADVELAVQAAQKAFDTVWGLNASGSTRSELLWSLAKTMEKHQEELAAIEALDNGEEARAPRVHSRGSLVIGTCRQNVRLGKRHRCRVLDRDYQVLRRLGR